MVISVFGLVGTRV
uniref:Uncharacterized protein n=1 Tax=Rhizophora mucronata TaxID=61149 RepID=A0A2P2KTM1_RHIMU